MRRQRSGGAFPYHLIKIRGILPGSRDERNSRERHIVGLNRLIYSDRSRGNRHIDKRGHVCKGLHGLDDLPMKRQRDFNLTSAIFVCRRI